MHTAEWWLVAVFCCVVRPTLLLGTEHCWWARRMGNMEHDVEALGASEQSLDPADQSQDPLAGRGLESCESHDKPFSGQSRREPNTRGFVG